MTQHTGGTPASTSLRDEPVPRVAREQAGAAGQRVADTASDQGAQVAREARAQARDLLGQAKDQVNEQARSTQSQAADSLHSLAGELREMADGGERPQHHRRDGDEHHDLLPLRRDLGESRDRRAHEDRDRRHFRRG